MRNISEVKNCYGCLTCVNKCPVKCISESTDIFGHIIPEVDNEKCIGCGLCLKVCPDLTENTLFKPPYAIAAWSKDEAQRDKSSSGGLATIIAEYVINNGGIVYGCAFVSPFEFKHIRCVSINDLNRLKGSKYVQSNINCLYNYINIYLKNNKTVLFIGTPCQVAAIKNFIGSNSQLITIDIICHGVPSLKLLKDSLPTNLTDSSFEISNITFRNNNFFGLTIYNQNTVIYERPLNRDLYFKAFFTGLDYRNSCYKCKFACIERIGDITVGDFWGLQLNLPTEEKNKGISVCLPNTIIGKKILDEIATLSFQFKRPLEEAIKGNTQLRTPKKKTIRTCIFRGLYHIVGFNKAVKFALPDIYIKNLLFKK